MLHQVLHLLIKYHQQYNQQLLDSKYHVYLYIFQDNILHLQRMRVDSMSALVELKRKLPRGLSGWLINQFIFPWHRDTIIKTKAFWVELYSKNVPKNIFNLFRHTGFFDTRNGGWGVVLECTICECQSQIYLKRRNLQSTTINITDQADLASMNLHFFDGTICKTCGELWNMQLVSRIRHIAVTDVFDMLDAAEEEEEDIFDDEDDEEEIEEHITSGLITQFFQPIPVLVPDTSVTSNLG